MPRRTFDFEKYALYDEITKKSTCLIETCRKELSGKLKSNIKRHYKLVHKQDIESDIDESDGEDVVVKKRKKYKKIKLNSTTDNDNCLKCCVGLLTEMLPDDNKEPEPKKKNYAGNEGKILNATLPVANESIIAPKKDLSQKEQQPSTSQNDSYQQMAQIWCRKLAKMSRMQRIIAEKVVNEVMFNGELGLLNLNTGLTNIGTVINTATTINMTEDDETKQEIIEIGNTNIFGL